MDFKNKRIHFVGIGGAGMSSIAEFLHHQGVVVSGSDISQSRVVEKLKSLGIGIFPNHDAVHIHGKDIVVFSSAIKNDNPEVIEAHLLKIMVLHRSQMLGLITQQYFTLAVCGTHGKTTTSSLLSYLLHELGEQPSAIIGGEILNFPGLCLAGKKGGYLVVEADESDGSFLNLSPKVGVVTNVDMDHLDHFSSHDQIKETFVSFLKNTQSTVYNIENQGACEVMHTLKGIKKRSFGISSSADLRAVNIESLDDFSICFDVVEKSKGNMGRVSFLFPGEHNVMNVLAALETIHELGLDLRKAIASCAGFKGVAHRFQILVRKDNLTIVDDYAHNPDKIQATLSAIKNVRSHTFTVAIFQPHRFSRLNHLSQEFVHSLDAADLTLVLPVYSAGEEKKGIDSNGFVILMKNQNKNCMLVESFDEVVTMLEDLLKKDSQRKTVFITLGAGSVKDLAKQLQTKFG